jgi:hypothetical protein
VVVAPADLVQSTQQMELLIQEVVVEAKATTKIMVQMAALV